MARAFVAANWKMHTTGAEATALAQATADRLSGTPVDVVLCPPFVWLDRVHQILSRSTIHLGAQDAFWGDWGAYTGEVSPVQLAELCRYVIVGHSERRTVLGESDRTVGRKLAAAQTAGLTPILAVGENRSEHERGATREVVSRQLTAALESGWRGGDLVVAYEPVWAIGSGTPATPEYAQTVASAIRELLSRLNPDARRVPILYGGSVSASTFEGFIYQPDIDGALVGGASLKIDEFAAIVDLAASARA